MIVHLPLEIARLSVSRETLRKLDAFESLVRRWNPAINLVSKQSLLHLRERHTTDSAQLMAFCPAEAEHWADLGAGGGFPGIVLAVLARELHPKLRFSLVESDGRKATFLRQAAQELGLPVTVLNQRIEAVAPLNADVVSARALAPLSQLLGHARQHLCREGVAVFPKGERHGEELADAWKAWRFAAETHPSLSDPNAAILVIRNIERAAET